MRCFVCKLRVHHARITFIYTQGRGERECRSGFGWICDYCVRRGKEASPQ